jgi:predicted DNA-binding transcriptional regulator AlpA
MRKDEQRDDLAGVKIDRVLSNRKTAKVLDCSLRTLRRLELRGELPPRTQITERIFGWRESQIREFLDARTRS